MEPLGGFTWRRLGDAGVLASVVSAVGAQAGIVSVSATAVTIALDLTGEGVLDLVHQTTLPSRETLVAISDEPSATAAVGAYLRSSGPHCLGATRDRDLGAGEVLLGCEKTLAALEAASVPGVAVVGMSLVGLHEGSRRRGDTTAAATSAGGPSWTAIRLAADGRPGGVGRAIRFEGDPRGPDVLMLACTDTRTLLHDIAELRDRAAPALRSALSTLRELQAERAAMDPGLTVLALVVGQFARATGKMLTGLMLAALKWSDGRVQELQRHLEGALSRGLEQLQRATDAVQSQDKPAAIMAIDEAYLELRRAWEPPSYHPLIHPPFGDGQWHRDCAYISTSWRGSVAGLPGRASLEEAVQDLLYTGALGTAMFLPEVCPDHSGDAHYDDPRALCISSGGHSPRLTDAGLLVAVRFSTTTHMSDFALLVAPRYLQGFTVLDFEAGPFAEFPVRVERWPE